MGAVIADSGSDRCLTHATGRFTSDRYRCLKRRRGFVATRRPSQTVKLTGAPVPALGVRQRKPC